jgi:hypothetical protein
MGGVPSTRTTEIGIRPHVGSSIADLVVADAPFLELGENGLKR